jgi:hypothetical protein
MKPAALLQSVGVISALLSLGATENITHEISQGPPKIVCLTDLSDRAVFGNPCRPCVKTYQSRNTEPTECRIVA